MFPKSRCSGYQARSRVVDSPTAGWCARRSPGAGSLTPPADGTEIKSTGSCRCGVSVAGASLDCQADLGAVGLNTEDPVFSCPSSQPPPSEAPLAAHLSPNPPTPSPKKTQLYLRRGRNILNQKIAAFRHRTQILKNESSAGSDNDANLTKSTLAPCSLRDGRDDGTTAERTSRPLARTGLIDSWSSATDWPPLDEAVPQSALIGRSIRQQRQRTAAQRIASDVNVNDYFPLDDVRAHFLRLLSSIGLSRPNRGNLGECEDIYWP